MGSGLGDLGREGGCEVREGGREGKGKGGGEGGRGREGERESKNLMEERERRGEETKKGRRKILHTRLRGH